MTKDDTDATPLASFDQRLIEVDAEGAADAIAKAGDRCRDLVDAWVAAKNAAAVAAVAANEHAPGPARKAARRGLNVLKARGIRIPERTHVERISGDGVEGYDAWFVPPDGAGTAVVVIGARFRSGKYRLVQAIVRDGVGLLELRANEMSRSQVKSSFEANVKRVGYAPASVPLDWARARVAAAKLENAKSGAVLPLGLDTHAEVLGPPPDHPPPHPIDRAELPQEASPIQGSASLHGEPEFAAWLPQGEAVQQLLVEVGQQIGALGPEPDQARVDAIISTCIDGATDRFFEPELRALVAARMKDVAISILARAGKARAADVMAVARATIAAGLITSPPREVPFLRAFFQKALAILAERSGGQLSVPVPEMPPGGLPSPAPTETGPTTPDDKTSPGGIILP